MCVFKFNAGVGMTRDKSKPAPLNNPPINVKSQRLGADEHIYRRPPVPLLYGPSSRPVGCEAHQNLYCQRAHYTRIPVTFYEIDHMLLVLDFSRSRIRGGTPWGEVWCDVALGGCGQGVLL